MCIYFFGTFLSKVDVTNRSVTNVFLQKLLVLPLFDRGLKPIHWKARKKRLFKTQMRPCMALMATLETFAFLFFNYKLCLFMYFLWETKSATCF